MSEIVRRVAIGLKRDFRPGPGGGEMDIDTVNWEEIARSAISIVCEIMLDEALK